MRVRKAVIPAAGLGTRFLPATKNQPKEMLPVVDKPVIQYVVEEAVQSGIELVILITGRGKGAIENHFDHAFELEEILRKRNKDLELAQIHDISEMVKVAYIRQKDALGLGHAILQAKELIGDEPFAVFLGDDIIHAQRPCMAQLDAAFQTHQNPVVAVQKVPTDQLGKYGVVGGTRLEDNLIRVTGMVEKPGPGEAPGDMAIIGRYILTPDIFPLLEKTAPDKKGEIQLTHALRELSKQRPLLACAFEGTRYDTGDRMGYLKANIEFALRRKDLGIEFRDYLKTLAKTL